MSLSTSGTPIFDLANEVMKPSRLERHDIYIDIGLSWSRTTAQTLIFRARLPNLKRSLKLAYLDTRLGMGHGTILLILSASQAPDVQ